MKALIYTDVHWCRYSSIIRSRGEKYSARLKALIKSVSWAEQLADSNGCDTIICLGDFFNDSGLNAEELTALNEVKWSKKCKHYFLVGNHEMAIADLTFSSAHILNMVDNIEVVDKVKVLQDNSTDIIFLPYMLPIDIKPFGDYITDNVSKKLVLSHNDLQIQYGQYKSTNGFKVEDIDLYCSLFVNGHLHNGENVSKKCINLGNLCGLDFSENAEMHDHCAMLIDTDTLSYKLYINPHAFNFYKFSEDSCERYLKYGFMFKPNSAVSAVADEKYYELVLKKLKAESNVVAHRVIIKRDFEGIEETKNSFTSIDHIEQFSNYVLANIGNTDDIKQELNEVCR